MLFKTMLLMEFWKKPVRKTKLFYFAVLAGTKQIPLTFGNDFKPFFL